MTDPAEIMDDVHHALGRPQTAERALQPYRDHYCLPVDDPKTPAFAASPWWRENLRINGGKDAIWKVTDAGKQACADWIRGKK